MILFYVPDMEDVNSADGHMTSAAAFVEGGIQDACDDSCSICLESFCDSDPSTVKCFCDLLHRHVLDKFCVVSLY